MLLIALPSSVLQVCPTLNHLESRGPSCHGKAANRQHRSDSLLPSHAPPTPTPPTRSFAATLEPGNAPNTNGVLAPAARHPTRVTSSASLNLTPRPECPRPSAPATPPYHIAEPLIDSKPEGEVQATGVQGADVHLHAGTDRLAQSHRSPGSSFAP